jgi:uncharacterized coiled-coil DUF342 family protein
MNLLEIQKKILSKINEKGKKIPEKDIISLIKDNKKLFNKDDIIRILCFIKYQYSKVSIDDLINDIESINIKLSENDKKIINFFDKGKCVANSDVIEQLEDLIAKEEGRGPQQERELYEEEKAKMQEWKDEVDRQNRDLEEIGEVVKQIKDEAKLASENIENTGKTVKKLTKRTDQVTKRVNTQNKKLKELIGKLRTGDKLCLDIILILVGLGLVAVLYKLIKARFF